MIGILLTGSLRSPPFGGCATTFPPQAGALQPVLNLESLMKKLPHGALFCHRLRGKSRTAGKGECIFSPAGRLYGFRRQRRHLYWRPQGRRTSPAQRYYITPEGGALNPPVRRSRSQAEPWQPRAERPGGWLNPHARKGVSTFGNTGKHRPGPDPDPDRAEGA